MKPILFFSAIIAMLLLSGCANDPRFRFGPGGANDTIQGYDYNDRGREGYYRGPDWDHNWDRL